MNDCQSSICIELCSTHIITFIPSYIHTFICNAIVQDLRSRKKIVPNAKCNKRCMNQHTRCKSRCDVDFSGNVKCWNGLLPRLCKRECCNEDVGTDPPTHDDGYEQMDNFKCDKLCMNGITTCSHWWRVYDVDTDGIGSVKCTHGWLPSVCNECCDEIDDSPNEDCPQKNVCTTECTVKKFVSAFHVCLEERMDTLTKTCEEECKPCPYRQPETSECPYYWIAKRIAQ